MYCLGDIFNAESSALMDLFWKKIFYLEMCICRIFWGRGSEWGTILTYISYLQDIMDVHAEIITCPSPEVHVSKVFWNIFQGGQERPNATVCPVVCHLNRVF